MTIKSYNRKLFGVRLSAIRSSRKITQEQLALHLGCKQAEIAHYEAGRRIPKDETIHKICDYFNIDFDWLKYGNDNLCDIYINDKHIKLEADLLGKKDASYEEIISLLKYLGPKEFGYLKSIINAMILYNNEDYESKIAEYTNSVRISSLINQYDNNYDSNSINSNVETNLKLVHEFRSDLWSDFIKNNSNINYFVNFITPIFKEWMKDKISEEPDFFKKKKNASK